MDPYEVLGVDRDANDKTIKSAYKKLTKKWHPDLIQNEEEKREAEEKLKRINEAYDIIKTAEKRSAYDAANPTAVNVYEHYARKTKEKGNENKRRDPDNIEEEKQRQAVLQFLEVEFAHKDEIFDMFSELANGALNGEFSANVYKEYLELILEEAEECIKNLRKIIAVVEKKAIKYLDVNLQHAQEVIEELTKKGNKVPKSLKQAHDEEEKRILTEKIHDLMKSFRGRLNYISNFDLLYKAWEFSNDKQLNSARKKHKKLVEQLLKDVNWVQETATEHNIQIGLIDISIHQYYAQELTFEQYKERVIKCKQISDMNLQQLREKFWQEKCHFSETSEGQRIFDRVDDSAECCKGRFICPPNIDGVDRNPFYWLKGIESISIPARFVTHEIVLPNYSLKSVIFTFDEGSKIVDVSNFEDTHIICMGNYICIKEMYPCIREFVLVDAKDVYVYDYKRLYELNGVTSMKQLEEVSKLWNEYSSWKNNYKLQIHTWAQLVSRLPHPNIMRFIPASIESVKKWLSLDRTNFEKVFLAVNDDDLKLRVVRLYIGLGALNGDYCHAQAEWLISKLDVSRMYRSRAERFSKEERMVNDPMFFIPKEIVDFVQENIKNKEFLAYVIVFLENYKMFLSGAKKAKTGLSPEFIIANATQHIFRSKADVSNPFVKQLLEEEKKIAPQIADKYLHIYNIAHKQLVNGITKNIIETADNMDRFSVNYRYFDLGSLNTYRAFEWKFKEEKTHYDAEVENVFLSSNTHAIEIIDGKGERIAIVILILFDEGELFADIVRCDNKNMEILEAVRRALFDQAACNNKIKAISIGMNEAPRKIRYNEWRIIVESSKADWIQGIRWIKFEHLFECKPLSTSYKGYRVRFILEGNGQVLNTPNPYDDPKIRRMIEKRNRRYW